MFFKKTTIILGSHPVECTLFPKMGCILPLTWPHQKYIPKKIFNDGLFWHTNCAWWHYFLNFPSINNVKRIFKWSNSTEKGNYIPSLFMKEDEVVNKRWYQTKPPYVRQTIMKYFVRQTVRAWDKIFYSCILLLECDFWAISI